MPRILWGSLEPGDQLAGLSAPLPDDRDTTDYTGNSRPSSNQPLFSSVDVENDWVFVAYATGFRIYMAGEKPQLLSGGDIRAGSCTPSGFFPHTPECSEVKHFFWDIEAPAGKDDVLAMAGTEPLGMTIIDTADKGHPFLHYQDDGKGSDPTNGTQAYVATIDGRDYAFLGVNAGTALGLHLYDMTAARSFRGCLENTTTGPIQCPGVYKGRIGDAKMVVYVDGTATASGKHYVAFSSGLFASDLGVEIWDVTSPGAPRNVRTSGGRFLANSSDDLSHGVALWEQAGRQYLAVHQYSGRASIYDVTDCLANGCTSLGSPLRTLSWADYGKAPGGVRFYVTFSRSGSTPFLYFSAADECAGGRQHEFLFDVSNASNPEEITPDGTITIDGKTIDYWGWYYSGNYYGGTSITDPDRHGFSRVMPAVAKFSGNVLYRAASTIFDTHVWTQWTPPLPTADFTWAPQVPIYPGDPVTFSDTSTGGTATSWSWTFQDAAPAGVTAPAVPPEPPR